MANPSLQIGNNNWAIKEDNLLGYSTAGSRFVPQPITMTRATLGTRVNPNGLVEDVALLGSENIDLTTGSAIKPTDWGSATTSGISYLATTGTISYYDTGFSVTSGITYKLSFTLSDYTGSSNLGFSGTGGVSNNAKLEADGSYSEYFIASSTAELRLFGRSTNTGVFSNVSVKEATIDNLPRVDYTDGTSSLLVEPQRTNIITYSEDFSQWSSKINIDVTLNSETSPDGVVNATFINENNSNAQHFIGQSLSITNGQDISISVYAKKNQRDVLQISPSGNYLSTSGYANYDLNNGLVTASGGGVTAEIEGLTNGWFRCVAKFTANNTASGTTAFSYKNSTTASRGSSYDGDGTSGLYMWGAQTEIGSYATSYIPTSGSTVTRNQETYEKTGISDKINSTEGVLFAELQGLVNSEGDRRLSISDGTISNRIFLYYAPTSNQVSGIIVAGGVTQINIPKLNIQTVNSKIAIRYKANDCSFWVDGVEVGTDTTATMPSGLSRLAFDDGSGNNKFFGKVKQLQVFKTALSDSELATLTT